MVRSFIALSLGCGLARGAVFNTQSFGSSEASDDQNLGLAQASDYDEYFDYANFELEEKDEEKVSFEESSDEDYYDYQLEDDEEEENADDDTFDMTNIEEVDNSSQFSPNPNNFDPIYWISNMASKWEFTRLGHTKIQKSIGAHKRTK